MFALFGIGPFELIILLSLVAVPAVIILAVKSAMGKIAMPPYQGHVRPCPNCRAAVTSDMTYCGYCGIPLGQPQQSFGPQPPIGQPQQPIGQPPAPGPPSSGAIPPRNH